MQNTNQKTKSEEHVDSLQGLNAHVSEVFAAHELTVLRPGPRLYYPHPTQRDQLPADGQHFQTTDAASDIKSP